MVTSVPREFLACANASNTFKGLVYLFEGMYAFQCLMKVRVVDHDGVTSAFQALECISACVGPQIGSWAFKDLCFHGDDAFGWTGNDMAATAHEVMAKGKSSVQRCFRCGLVLCSCISGKRMPIVWDPGVSWSLGWEAESFTFDPGGSP
ncbi:hypothetical protein GOP47_0016108 [Adiantum capillus-veneris]|uniref:Uncharacterized protein n=1 Tax=Adiantum capillus-veneris TaxID=13818 RepID=A0A9D4ULQ5_ADICA|nr:hypothetical protein GOP47_0016108 [Adiantum capillus-veneris]